MEKYRNYQCEYNHFWTTCKLDTEAERVEETFCDEGHEAIICQIQEPADEVQILIKPASRIDPQQPPYTVYHKDEYWFILLDRAGIELHRSSTTYLWEKVIKLAGFFQGKSAEEATKWWNRRNL